MDGAEPVDAVVVFCAPGVFFVDDAVDAVEQVEYVGVSDGVELGAVDGDAFALASCLKSVVFHSPSPEAGEPVEGFKVGAADGEDSAEGVVESVVMFDGAEWREVVEDVCVGDGVEVVEDEDDVAVMVGVLFLDSEESDVFHGASVEGADVALVGENDFVVPHFALGGFGDGGCGEDGGEVLNAEHFLLRAVAVRKDEHDFWDMGGSGRGRGRAGFCHGKHDSNKRREGDSSGRRRVGGGVNLLVSEFVLYKRKRERYKQGYARAPASSPSYSNLFKPIPTCSRPFLWRRGGTMGKKGKYVGGVYRKKR